MNGNVDPVKTVDICVILGIVPEDAYIYLPLATISRCSGSNCDVNVPTPSVVRYATELIDWDRQRFLEAKFW